MDLRELDLVDPKDHWYYKSKLIPVVGSIIQYKPDPHQVIDVGAGSGYFSHEIIKKFPNCKAFCVDLNYSSEELQRNGNVEFVRSLDCQLGDVLIFMDVLEHVDDARSLLSGYLKNALKGSLVIVTVPAFMTLWSNHDEFLGHKRRYTKREIRDLLEDLNIEVLNCRYLFSVILPLVWIKRRLFKSTNTQSDMSQNSSILNAILTGVLGVEHRITRNPLGGLSVFAVGRI